MIATQVIKHNGTYQIIDKDDEFDWNDEVSIFHHDPEHVEILRGWGEWRTCWMLEDGTFYFLRD